LVEEGVAHDDIVGVGVYEILDDVQGGARSIANKDVLQVTGRGTSISDIGDSVDSTDFYHLVSHHRCWKDLINKRSQSIIVREQAWIRGA
jgi:hypothetical protein